MKKMVSTILLGAILATSVVSTTSCGTSGTESSSSSTTITYTLDIGGTAVFNTETNTI